MTEAAQWAACVFGSVLLCLTGLGVDTYKAYRRAEEHFKQNDGFDERYEFKMLHQSAYCYLVGFALAKRDLKRKFKIKARLE